MQLELATTSVTKSNFVALASNSFENMLSFARFVQLAETFCGTANPFISKDNTAQYDEVWFEMEIINALALSAWEDAGKPEHGCEAWDFEYQANAKKLVGCMLKLIVNAE
nr:hypothetical protein [Chromobacterium sp. ASV5]